MHFALGKVFEDNKDFHESFKHYELGNKLKIPYTKYKIKKFE